MHLPHFILQEIGQHLESKEIILLRRVSKLWMLSFSPMIFRRILFRTQLTQYCLIILEKYGYYITNLLVKVSQNTVLLELLDDLIKNSSLIPNVNTFYTFNVSSENVKKTTALLKNLPCLKRFGTSTTFLDFPDSLWEGFEKLDYLLIRFPFQADIYSLLANLSCSSLKKLSVIYSHPEASAIEKLRNIFPSIDNLELATGVDSKDYSAKVDFKTFSFTEVFGYFDENILISLSFKEPRVAHKKPPSEMDLLCRFKDIQTIIKSPERVNDLIDLIPKLKALHLSFTGMNLNLDRLNSFITKIECIEIDYRSHSFPFYNTEIFSARRLSLNCKFGIEAKVLNWVALRFPKLEILEFGSPSEDITWKEIFPSLTHLICHCPNLKFLMHILRLTPKIRSLAIFLSNGKKLNMDIIYVAYPNISISIKEIRYMVMANNNYY